MRLRVDDAPAKPPGATGRGLLALLLITPGRTVPAPSLIDQPWSESSPPADPLTTLQPRVSKLRRALATHGIDVVVREASGYRANVEADRVDMHQFVTRVRARSAARSSGTIAGADAALGLYDEALALWRGDPLADFAGGSGDGRGRSARAAACGGTERSCRGGTERACRGGAARRPAPRGRSRSGAGRRRRPGREALAGLMMTALYRAARQSDALEVFAAPAVSKVLLAVELLDGSDQERLGQLLHEADEQCATAADVWGHAVVAFVRLQNYLRRGDELRARGRWAGPRRRRSAGSTTPGGCRRRCTTRSGD
jgi:DNA-binding SARP family transcriptional activator